jgi:hypothetical protein
MMGAMLVEHRGKRPTVHESVWVAPTAVVCGDVHLGEDVRIMWNAVVSAEDGRVELPPDRHDDIWAIQEGLDFPGTVYREPRGDDLMARVMARQTAWLAAHRDDRAL